MRREYVRVTPTSANIDPDAISTALSSLHKLSPSNSKSSITRSIPFLSAEPLTFEFVAISEGEDEPVEFYYGVNAHLDVLQQRLQTIYPSSFDIDRVDVDLVEKLLQPVESRPTELHEGEVVAWLDGPATAVDRDVRVGADRGTIVSQPSLEDVTPYGVQWRGSVDRRKDWMTSLTDFSEMVRSNPVHAHEESARTGRAPLAPLIDQLTSASRPLAFQVVFRRKPDWSRQAGGAPARSSPGRTRSSSSSSRSSLRDHDAIPGRVRQGGGRGRRVQRQSGSERSPTEQPRMRDRERAQETTTRLDLLRENTPGRTFTVNARLLALATSDDDLEELETRLDTLCSVFDPIDGSCYEIEVERIREHGVMSRTADRRARSALERFRSPSVATRRRDFLPKPTNNRETPRRHRSTKELNNSAPFIQSDG